MPRRKYGAPEPKPLLSKKSAEAFVAGAEGATSVQGIFAGGIEEMATVTGIGAKPGPWEAGTKTGKWEAGAEGQWEAGTAEGPWEGGKQGKWKAGAEGKWKQGATGPFAGGKDRPFGPTVADAFRDPNLVGSRNEITEFDGTTYSSGGRESGIDGGGGGTGNPLAAATSAVQGLGLKTANLQGASLEEVVGRGARRTKKTGQKRTQ